MHKKEKDYKSIEISMITGTLAEDALRIGN